MNREQFKCWKCSKELDPGPQKVNVVEVSPAEFPEAVGRLPRQRGGVPALQCPSRTRRSRPRKRIFQPLSRNPPRFALYDED